MIELALVQAHAVALIAAVAPFVTDTTVARPMAHKDNGHLEAAEEKSLREKGYFATVLPILDADKVSEGAGKTLLDAGLGVRVAVNPKFLPAIDVLALVKAVKQALTSWDPPHQEQERYKVAEKAFFVDDTDPGEFAYIFFLTKRCVL